MNPPEYPLWTWLLFFAIVLIALGVDIGIVNRGKRSPSKLQTSIWSVVWVSLASLFGLFVFLKFGTFKGTEYFTGYLIELSLSIDNLFVFLLIFRYFKVPAEYQHRVLFWGIMMALVLRMVMIFAGAQLVESFQWILYLFGAFLIYTGINMVASDDVFEPHESLVIRIATRHIPIARHYDEEKFFTVVDGKRTGTLLLLVMVVINIADIIFAVDSIPAIFGITTDRFIVYTSNIFAILGLRTFYSLLASLADRFHLLKYGLAFVLSFIGLKMLLPLLAQGLIMIYGQDGSSGFSRLLARYLNNEFEHELITISLVVVLGSIAAAIILSILFPPRRGTGDHQ